MRIIQKVTAAIPLISKLGVLNVLYVLLYRFAKKIDFWEKIAPISNAQYSFELIPENKIKSDSEHIVCDLDSRYLRAFASGFLKLFSDQELEVGNPPRWFVNPYNGRILGDSSSNHWSKLDDFSLNTGDIKSIWDISRFGWSVQLAFVYKATGDIKYLTLFNKWINDWVYQNPVNRGPHWKCGQEVTIRLLHLLLAAHIMGCTDKPANCLINFVIDHAKRIEITIRYAIAQSNNHGINEAAGLFIAGSWLLNIKSVRTDIRNLAGRWQRKGKKWLHKLVGRLIEEDGSFSQYSMNYHRMLLDILSMVQFWCDYLSLSSFSDEYYSKIGKAINWLFQMTDPTSGKAPNIGANDGSLLFQVDEYNYQDFRRSVQLATALFLKEKVFLDKNRLESFYWLGINWDELDSSKLKRKSTVFPKGGYIAFKASNSWAVVRLPSYTFRPSHADALHFDLWHQGENILRDAGTFSYNCQKPWQEYFPGTQSHNTIEFDNRDQMPAISRFLFGHWLKGKVIQPLTCESEKIQWTGCYIDHEGCYHERYIQYCDDRWLVKDKISGYEKIAILRWRLIPDEWILDWNKCSGKYASLEIIGDLSNVDIVLEEGWESNYYMEKMPLPVLSAYIHDLTANISTIISLK